MESSQAEYPNAGRQLGIDLAKCLAIIFMVGIHALMLFDADFSTPFCYYFDMVFGSILAAPVFMVAMGVGLAYSKKATPMQFVSRGINIFTLAYLLNIIRILPSYVIAGVYHDFDLLFEVAFIYTFDGDILGFAGIALMLFGLLKLLKLKDYWVLAVGAIFSLAATFIPVVVTDNVFLNAFAGLFTITSLGDIVSMEFPLLSWFIFPCFGYWYGNRLKNSQNPNHFHLVFGLIGAVIAVTGFVLSANLGFGFVGDLTELTFYGMKIYDALFCAGASIALFALCHYLTLISPKALQTGYLTMANSLNLIYLIHWPVLTFISMPVVYFEIYLPIPAILAIAAGIACASTALGILLKGFIKRKTSENPHTLWRYVNAG